MLLIFTALYHVTLNAALDPLIKYLPKTIGTGERSFALAPAGAAAATQKTALDGGELGHKNGVAGAQYGVADTQNGIRSVDAEKNGNGDMAPTTLAEVDPVTGKKPNFLLKFLKPHIYADYEHMRRLVPAIIPGSDVIDEGLIRDAYLPPSVWDELPMLLVPRDSMGVSAQECAHTSKVTPMNDSVASLNDKNKIIVDDDQLARQYFSDKDQIFHTTSLI